MQYQVSQIFPAALYHGRVDISDSERTTLVDRLMYESNSTSVNELSVNYNLQLVQDDDLISIHNKIQQHVDSFVYDTLKVCSDAVTAKIIGSWTLKTRPGESQAEHHHRNSMLSGVLYVNSEKGSGDIIINGDHRDHKTFDLSVEPTYEATTIYNQWLVPFTPVTGDIIIFPSYYKHGVSVNKTNSVRCSMAFDVYLEGDRNSTPQDIFYCLGSLGEQ